MNIREATQKWVDSFNAIPQSLIRKAYMENTHELNEITPLIYECEVCGSHYSESSAWSLDYKCCGEQLEPQTAYEYLPMWGTMWTFGSRLDEEWAEDNLNIMASYGFRIYESEELGIYFGIDGAGYDFYDAHWIPLYRYRGLKWHDKEG